MNVKRAIIVSILGVVAVIAPGPGACDTYVRDDLNLLRADTFSGIQRRNADLIARNGACIDVLTLAAVSGDAGTFALNTARAFGNHCGLAAVIMVTQTGSYIRFEDASFGIRSSYEAISNDLGKGIASGDVNGAVMSAVNAIADGVIAHPAPSPPPPVYASPPPEPSVVDTVIGVLAANWQTNIGRLAIIAGCLLVIILIAGATARGRSN